MNQCVFSILCCRHRLFVAALFICVTVAPSRCVSWLESVPREFRLRATQYRLDKVNDLLEKSNTRSRSSSLLTEAKAVSSEPNLISMLQARSTSALHDIPFRLMLRPF